MGSKKKILILDDDPPMLESLEALLDSAGYDFISFSDPKDAMEALRSGVSKISMVITDFEMPGMNGLEFIETFCELNPGVPSFIISGKIPEISPETRKRLQILQVVQKPIDVDSFLNNLKHYFSSLN